MELRKFTITDSSGETGTMIAHDREQAVNSWKYAHPGVEIVSVEEVR